MPVDAGLWGIDASVPLAQAACSPDGGWCWRNPLPHANDLNDVALVNGNFNDVWAVGGRSGYRNLAFHYDGTRWTLVATPQTTQPDAGASTELFSTWAFSANDVWAGGSRGLLLHWDGARFTAVRSGTNLDIISLWGSPTGTLWLGTTSGFLRSVADGGFELPTTGWSLFTVNSISGSAADDIWFAGNSSSMLHLTEGRYRDGFYFPGFATLRGIWSSDRCDAWVAGSAGTSRWTGSGWNVVGNGGNAVDGTNAANVWVASSTSLQQFLGGTPQTNWPSNGPGFFKSVSVGAQGLWAVGSEGLLAASTGGAPTLVTRSAIPAGVTLAGVYVAAPDNVFIAASNATIVRWNGTTWSSTPIGPVSTQWLGIHGTSANDIWAVGTGGAIAHFDGSSWAMRNSFTGVTLSSVWAASPTTAWAVGAGGTTLRLQAGVWNLIAQPTGAGTSFTRVWGSSANDVWAVGSGNKLIRSSGSTWFESTIPANQAVADVFGVSGNRVWLATRTGTAVFYNGLQYTTLTGWPQGIFQLWGTSETDLYAAAQSGTGLFHFDGITWSPVDIPSATDFLSVHGSGAQIWAVGSRGSVIAR